MAAKISTEMATVVETLEVIIDGEKYSLLSRPSEKSALVREEKDKLHGLLDLEQLVKYLGHVGSFIRIAYNGVVAAGPKYINDQIEIQRLGYDITKLCDKSAITVSSFESASKTVLDELETAYEFLLDGFEDQAIISFSNLSELARKMAAAAHDLQLEFENQEKKVIITLETTQQNEAEAKIEKEKLEKEREKMELRKQDQEKILVEQKRLEQEAHQERLYYEQKEDEEIDSAHSGVLAMVGAMITPICPMVGVAILWGVKEKEAAHTKKANEWKKKSLQKLEAEKELCQLQQKGLQQMAEFTSEIQRLRSEGNDTKIAIKALHEACTALKHLSFIMRQAALFWEHLSTHCESLAQPAFQAGLNNALENYSDDKKKKFFTSSSFIKKAVAYYSRWVALNSVCREYLFQLKLTREDLYNYIKENPTTEKSREQLPILAKEFENELKSAQVEIAERDFETDKEMKMLKDN